MFRRRSILIGFPSVTQLGSGPASAVGVRYGEGLAAAVPPHTISDHARALSQHSGHSYRAKRDHTTEQLKREMGL